MDKLLEDSFFKDLMIKNMVNDARNDYAARYYYYTKRLKEMKTNKQLNESQITRRRHAICDVKLRCKLLDEGTDFTDLDKTCWEWCENKSVQDVENELTNYTIPKIKAVKEKIKEMEKSSIQ